MFGMNFMLNFICIKMLVKKKVFVFVYDYWLKFYFLYFGIKFFEYIIE